MEAYQIIFWPPYANAIIHRSLAFNFLYNFIINEQSEAQEKSLRLPMVQKALSSSNLSRAEKQKPKVLVSKTEARKRLDRFQTLIGLALIASASFGIYLLVTDKSLWLLAVSHAYGLVAICVIDILLGVANMYSSRKAILPSLGWAILTIMLQLADIATAPQYKMTVQYFAHYLFTLWAYDGLLAMQFLIIAIILSARSYQKMLAKKKRPTYFDMGLRNSRRDFLQIAGSIGALLVISAALGVWSVFSSPKSSPPPNSGPNSGPASNLPQGAVANVNLLSPGVPSYFDYPSTGYINMLLKKSDGTVTALSMLCTHVCCQCQYDANSTDIFCPCHGSVFNQSGKVLRGPASTNLPSIKLSIDAAGNIFPVGIVGSGPCVSGS